MIRSRNVVAADVLAISISAAPSGARPVGSSLGDVDMANEPARS